MTTPTIPTLTEREYLAFYLRNGRTDPSLQVAESLQLADDVLLRRSSQPNSFDDFIREHPIPAILAGTAAAALSVAFGLLTYHHTPWSEANSIGGAVGLLGVGIGSFMIGCGLCALFGK